MAANEVYLDCTEMTSAEEMIRKMIVDANNAFLLHGHPKDPLQMLDLEQNLSLAGTLISDLNIALAIIRAHQDKTLFWGAMVKHRKQLLKKFRVKYIKNPGKRTVVIQLPGGLTMALRTPYLRPTRKQMRGRPRGSGRRGVAGAGCYPLFEQLGIVDRVTPLTRSRISRMMVLCSSYLEAQEQLAQEGMDLDPQTLVRIAVGTGERANKLRNDALNRAREIPPPEVSPVAGKRLRISVDGGRLRERLTQWAQKKGENGRRPFLLDWTEPRLIVIDVIDEEGKRDRSFPYIYEATIAHADDVFAMMTGMLRLIGANQAKEVLFISDGATWIWNRVEKLFKDAGLSEEQVTKILDFYHGTEHIMKALKECKNMGPKAREALFKELRDELLEDGGVERVLERLRGLARGRRGKKLSKEIKTLERRKSEMEYSKYRHSKLPIGSGVVESGIRRVVNQRFKSAGMCWERSHVEALLSLRCQLKAERWEQFMRAVLSGRYWLEEEVDRVQVRGSCVDLAA